MGWVGVGVGLCASYTETTFYVMYVTRGGSRWWR